MTETNQPKGLNNPLNKLITLKKGVTFTHIREALSPLTTKGLILTNRLSHSPRRGVYEEFLLPTLSTYGSEQGEGDHVTDKEIVTGEVLSPYLIVDFHGLQARPGYTLMYGIELLYEIEWLLKDIINLSPSEDDEYYLAMLTPPKLCGPTDPMRKYESVKDFYYGHMEENWPVSMGPKETFEGALKLMDKYVTGDIDILSAKPESSNPRVLSEIPAAVLRIVFNKHNVDSRRCLCVDLVIHAIRDSVTDRFRPYASDGDPVRLYLDLKEIVENDFYLLILTS